mmetsp:Transcript_27455/g.60071  ORF Transcript_27455/g.60071 Transcript_27455/m.60071 type:complete len:352 (-) Transcript_27455:563-1618(-)
MHRPDGAGGPARIDRIRERLWRNGVQQSRSGCTVTARYAGLPSEAAPIRRLLSCRPAMQPWGGLHVVICERRWGVCLLRGVPHSVLLRVEKNLLAMPDERPGGVVEALEALTEDPKLLLEDVIVLPHAVQSHLRHQKIFGLRRALHAHTACYELVDGQLTTVIVVKQLKDVLRIGDGKVDHLEFVEDLRLVDRVDDFLECQSATPVNVSVFKDFPQLAEDKGPVPLSLLPREGLVPLGSCDRAFNNDAYDDVQDAEGGQCYEEEKNGEHPWLPTDHMPDNAVAPVVQGENLGKGQDRPHHCLEVDLVVPAVGLQEVRVVKLIVVAHHVRREDSKHVADHEHQQADPEERLH